MFNVKKLVEASEILGKEKNVDPAAIHEITIAALERAYIRILNGGIKSEDIDLPDPRVKVVLDTKKGKADFYQIKTIKQEVNDDMLEIDLEDAQEIMKNPNLTYEQDVEIHDENIDIDELNKIFIKQFKNVFHQRLNEAEREALYEAYKDHIGEIVLGEVEKVEERGVGVKIGNHTIYLSRKEMIGDETFTVGQQIKLYLADTSNDKKGSIAVTRSHPGFVKRLFEEEIREIYDGTIVIKGIARKAGQRSKVAVYSNDHDVDATGSCIGKDGGRINKIVNQLGGNGRDKEKIDIVAYSDNPSLYIIDALRPAEVIGINIDQDDDEAKEATCIVKDGQYSKAIGLRGINIRLAANLTGYGLTILEENEASKEGLKYTKTEDLKAQEAVRLEEVKKSEFAKHSLAFKEEKEKEKEAELKKVMDNAIASKEEAKAKKVAQKKSSSENKVTPTVHHSSLEEELAKAKAAASRAEKREAEHVEIKTTTNILDLEKQLEEQKEAEKKAQNKPSKRPRKITEEEVPNEEKKEEKAPKEEIKKMDIYTEEELREMEEEEKDLTDAEDFDEEDDVDYDEYDEYYDDEK